MPAAGPHARARHFFPRRPRRLELEGEGSMVDFAALLRFAVEHAASDIHIQAGLPPTLRLGGLLKAVNQPPISDEEVRKFISSIAPPRMRDNLDDRIPAGMDFSYALPGLSRFRCSVYRHLGNAGIAMRVIRRKIPTLEELHLPPVIGE